MADKDKKKKKSNNPSTGVKLPKFKMSRQKGKAKTAGKMKKHYRGKFRNK